MFLSKGRGHRHEVLDDSINEGWRPLLNACDRLSVYTDYFQGHHWKVDFLREPWMATTEVIMRGDKSQLAALLRKPCLLFDNRWDNIALLRGRCTDQIPLNGALVRRGAKAWDPERPGFSTVRTAEDFVDAAIAFDNKFRNRRPL